MCGSSLQNTPPGAPIVAPLGPQNQEDISQGWWPSTFPGSRTSHLHLESVPGIGREVQPLWGGPTTCTA